MSVTQLFFYLVRAGLVDSSIFTIEEDRLSHDYDEVASDEGEPEEKKAAPEVHSAFTMHDY